VGFSELLDVFSWLIPRDAAIQALYLLDAQHLRGLCIGHFAENER